MQESIAKENLTVGLIQNKRGHENFYLKNSLYIVSQ